MAFYRAQQLCLSFDSPRIFRTFDFLNEESIDLHIRLGQDLQQKDSHSRLRVKATRSER